MRLVVVVMLVALGACSSEEPSQGAGAADGGGGAGNGPDVDEGGRGEGGSGGLAFEDKTCPTVVTSFTTTVDLRAGASVLGTCGRHDGGAATTLPDDPAQYPIRVLLPAVEAADPACEVTCNGNPEDPVTTFGIALGIEDNGHRLRTAGLAPIIVAPSPWLVVSGGCGEACPHPCLGGYQEFGEPLACLGPTHANGFGFATAANDVLPLEAFVDLTTHPF